jgi:hypothetical protein
MQHTISWCGNGATKITSHEPPRVRPDVHSWFWSWEGVDEAVSFAQVQEADFIQYFEAYTVGHFKGCATGPQIGLLCDNIYPWFNQIGTPNGGYSTDAGS